MYSDSKFWIAFLKFDSIFFEISNRFLSLLWNDSNLCRIRAMLLFTDPQFRSLLITFLSEIWKLIRSLAILRSPEKCILKIWFAKLGVIVRFLGNCASITAPNSPSHFKITSPRGIQITPLDRTVWGSFISLCIKLFCGYTNFSSFCFLRLSYRIIIVRVCLYGARLKITLLVNNSEDSSCSSKIN